MLSIEKVYTAINRIKYFAPVDGDKYYLWWIQDDYIPGQMSFFDS